MVYVALLRGINVGGNTLIKMAELKVSLEKAGMREVKTYIQSGNIIFRSDKPADKLASIIESAITKDFKLTVPVLVLAKNEYAAIIKNVPKGWGGNPGWKYNLLFLLHPYDTQQVLESIGTIKSDIEALTPGAGVIYQAMSIKLFGQTTSGKLASNPVYKRMTVRNHRTGQRLLDLMEAL